MSSTSSVGGDTAQRWQQLKESRASQANESGIAKCTRSPLGPPAAGSVDASGNPSAASSISSASDKVITDLKALFIDLQSGASATRTTPVATTAEPSSGASAQSDLQTLVGDLGKVGGGKIGGHHGGHHAHHAPPTDTASTDLATSPTASAASTAGQPAAKPAGSIVDQLLGALKAYAASSSGNPATAATSLSA